MKNQIKKLYPKTRDELIKTNLLDIYVSRSYNDRYKIFRNSLGILLVGSLTDYNLPTYNVFPNPEIPFTEIEKMVNSLLFYDNKKRDVEFND